MGLVRRLGQFLQTDPVGYEDDLNLYAYVRNDPLNGNDPTGLTVYLSGSEADRNQFEQIAEQATNVSLSQTLAIDTAPKDKLDVAGQVLMNAIGSTKDINVNAVSGLPNILVDSFATNEVDVADLAGIQNSNPDVGAALVTHVLSERLYEAETGTGFGAAHQRGLIDESASMGAATRMDNLSLGNFVPGGTWVLEYLDPSGATLSSHSFTFDSNLTPH